MYAKQLWPGPLCDITMDLQLASCLYKIAIEWFYWKVWRVVLKLNKTSYIKKKFTLNVCKIWSSILQIFYYKSLLPFSSILFLLQSQFCCIRSTVLFQTHDWSNSESFTCQWLLTTAMLWCNQPLLTRRWYGLRQNIWNFTTTNHKVIFLTFCNVMLCSFWGWIWNMVILECFTDLNFIWIHQNVLIFPPMLVKMCCVS